MQHLQVSGFHPFEVKPLFRVGYLFFWFRIHMTSSPRSQGRCFCGFNGHFGHLCCWRVWSKQIRRFKNMCPNAACIYQPGSWLELIFNPQISSHNGFFELINPGKLTCPLKRDNFNRKYIFQALIFKGHVSFPGSITTVDGQHLNCWQLQHGKYPKQSTVGFYYRSKLLHHLEFKRFVSLTEEWHNASLSIQIFTNIWWYMDLRTACNVYKCNL